MVQAASAKTQRGWKRQPGGRSNGGGTVPSIASSRSRFSSIFGMLPSKPERVGMLRVVEDRRAWRAFHHAAGIHHGDLVGHFGDDAKIVGDQDDRHAGFLLQFAQQVEDLRLHRDIERGGGFVGDQQVGRAGQRHGDHHALAHAAGHLVRIFVEAAFRRGNAHALQRGDRARRAAQPRMQCGRARASPR